ncbi:MAG: ATP-binding protein [Candidatus Kapaibacterium sp.]
MIKRELGNSLKDKLFKGKVIILYGPRQCGKTTLINNILKDINKKVLFLDGEEYNVRQQLENPSSEKLKLISLNSEIIFIDEAQKIPDIGNVLKLFHDKIPGVQVIATGSSAFELAGKTSEPLTGRKFEYTLLPVSFGEMLKHTNFIEENSKLETRLIFGSYPEVINNPSDSKELIKLIAKSYLYKDLFSLEKINSPDLFEKIVSALALQIGSEVSYKEIALTVGANHLTVSKYISLLEKAYVVFKLPAYNRNLRNEIRKGKKYYFYDNGIRNAVIDNFNVLEKRNDSGALWENYLVSERRKFLMFHGMDRKNYFWRNIQKQEVDYLEEENGEISAYEFKWSNKAKARFTKSFVDNYSPVTTALINPQNYYEFLTLDSERR